MTADVVDPSEGDAAAAAAAAERWLTQAAAPLWLDAGVDRRHGGFFEALGTDGRSVDLPYKRLRVTCRQIYAFTTLAAHGVGGAEEAARHGLDFLLTRFDDGQGGFALRVDTKGHPLEVSPDLYDWAFALFALAHAHAFTNDSALVDRAALLLGTLEARLAHPAGGWAESYPPVLPRRQNSHMHLFEACLAWTRLGGAVATEAPLRECRRLLTERFLQRGALHEYYGEDWLAAPHPAGGVTEPGHHFEWVRLLDEYERLGGWSTTEAEALHAFALRFGRDAGTGFLYAEVAPDGAVLSVESRLWAHAEWVRAETTRRRQNRPARIGEAWSALSRFLDHPCSGRWHERVHAPSGRFRDEPAPATSLYHIVGAIAALSSAATQLS